MVNHYPALVSRDEEPVIDIMDGCCAAVIDKWSHLLPSSERAALQNVDLQWLSERSSPVWTSGNELTIWHLKFAQIFKANSTLHQV